MSEKQVSDWRCPSCGYMVDTPMHELGCKLGQLDRLSDSKQEGERCGGEGIIDRIDGNAR